MTHLVTFQGQLGEQFYKKHAKTTHVKKSVLGPVQNAVPEATRTSGRSRDVRPRRSNRAFWKGKVKARTQKAQHLGQDSEPKGFKSEIQDPNYTYAHLLKGGLYIYMYI